MELTQNDGVRTKGTVEQLLAAVRGLLGSVKIRRRERSLQLCETLPLGDRRLLALVQCQGRKYLIGATSQTISMLDCLESETARESSLRQAECEREKNWR